MKAMKTILNREEREVPRRESPAGGLTETMPSSGELQLHDSGVESRRLPVRHSRFLAYFAVCLSYSP